MTNKSLSTNVSIKKKPAMWRSCRGSCPLHDIANNSTTALESFFIGVTPCPSRRFGSNRLHRHVEYPWKL